MDMLQAAACCRVPDRWALLYRVLWRWQQGEHDVMSAADPDGARLHAMVKAVKREEHNMHAYMRFRERDPAAGAAALRRLVRAGARRAAAGGAAISPGAWAASAG